VHIRYSDYHVRIFAIIKQLNALLKRKRDLQVFLATDNIEIKKMFERNFPGVVSTSHWYAKPGAPIHVDRARNPSITLTVYSHWFSDAEEQNRETMGDLAAAVLAPSGSTVVAHVALSDGGATPTGGGVLASGSS